MELVHIRCILVCPLIDPFVLIHIIISQINYIGDIFAGFKIGIAQRHIWEIRILLLSVLDQGNQFPGIVSPVIGFLD